MPTQIARYTPLGHAYFATTSSTAKSLTTGATSGTASSTIAQKAVKAYIIGEAALRYYLDGTTPNASEGLPLAINTLLVVDTDLTLFRFCTTGAAANVYVEFVGA